MNPPTRKRIVVANTATAIVTMVFSVILLIDPTIALSRSEHVDDGTRMYGQATAIRTLLLAAIILPVLIRRPGASVALLVLTGLTQAADTMLHAVHGNLVMVPPAIVLACVPIVSALCLRRGQPRQPEGQG